MKICIIDDSGMIQNIAKEFLSKYGEVETLWRIPEDVSELEKFDALVVDNDGIGNKTWIKGSDFLAEYAGSHASQLIVHYSGYISRETAEKLIPLGVKMATKGWRIEETLGTPFDEFVKSHEY